MSGRVIVNDVHPNIAATLKRLRLAHGYETQELLAEAAGLAPSTVSMVEAGRRNLSRKSCDAVAAAMGLEPDEYAELALAAGLTKPEGVVATFAERFDDLNRRVARLEELIEGALARRPRRGAP